MHWKKSLKVKLKSERSKLLAKARIGEIVFLEHRYRGRMILKVICADKEKLIAWGQKYRITEQWLHISRSGLPHFDLWGSTAAKFKKIARW